MRNDLLLTRPEGRSLLLRAAGLHLAWADGRPTAPATQRVAGARKLPLRAGGGRDGILCAPTIPRARAVEPAAPAQSTPRPRVLTGDTPTGRLHLGHYVGTVENRLELQEDHDCFFIIANKHAFTTRSDRPEDIRQSVLDLATDYLACGIDPSKSSTFIQSEVPAIDELTFYFSMLLPFNRVMRNPTLKDELRDKDLGDSYPFGFPLYAVGQTADILAFRPSLVPVGEDQVPHLEMTREVARRFHQLYGRSEAGEVILPVPQLKVGRVERLVGLGGPGKSGRLLKMSKSLGNAIFLSDPPDVVRRKIMGMYTDPQRIRATDPGRTEDNPLWIFHDAFNPDRAWVEEHKNRYRLGQVGDAVCKRALLEPLNELLNPIRERRLYLEQHPEGVLDALRQGTERARAEAQETLDLVKRALHQDFF